MCLASPPPSHPLKPSLSPPSSPRTKPHPDTQPPPLTPTPHLVVACPVHQVIHHQPLKHAVLTRSVCLGGGRHTDTTTAAAAHGTSPAISFITGCCPPQATCAATPHSSTRFSQAGARVVAPPGLPLVPPLPSPTASGLPSSRPHHKHTHAPTPYAPTPHTCMCQHTAPAHSLLQHVEWQISPSSCRLW